VVENKSMKLGESLADVTNYHLEGDRDLEITGLTYDSRRVRPGYLFVAIKGHSANGHDYVHSAVQRGAVAVVAEDFGEIQGPVAKVRVPNSRLALSKMAVQFFCRPFESVNLIGITGTNGKTTTSYILESILHVSGAKPGVVGTVNYRIGEKNRAAPVTTPESLDLMGLLKEMADEGATHVIMEVSSHALDQKRTADCPFRVAIFTNLSRDHLDYHKTMDAYFEAKSQLFCGLRRGRPEFEPTAVINMDDPRGNILSALTDAAVVTYGLGDTCQVRAESVVADKAGIRATLITPEGQRPIQSRLIGRHNIYNILAAAAAALSLGVSLGAVVEGVARLNVIPGRLEPVANPRNLSLVVDYSHTPDALLKALEALRPYAEERLITVFGCGGDRDKGKRHEMGLVAGTHSDLVFVTSDNPRSEDPQSIVKAIEKGVQESGLKRMSRPINGPKTRSGYVLEVDRRKAIRMAVAAAGEKDVVLIAGKGHEDYQILGTERRHFDDREEAALAAREDR
jgi:UDP-N-acetylmuramoyl-L-alanyl-D-glutamate--2,6-diaminopimelate ligase